MIIINIYILIKLKYQLKEKGRPNQIQIQKKMRKGEYKNVNKN